MAYFCCNLFSVTSSIIYLGISNTYFRGLPLHIVADLHGCLTQVLRLFRYCGSPHKETFLFLGDYVDRGVQIQGVELITLLFCLKVRYPTQVYLLRGNHEDANTTLNYGFFDECNNDRNGDKVTIVAGTIFCAHGGISPFIKSLDDINKIKRPSVVPAYGIGCDLLWSDPSTLGDGWILSHRGISFLFGQKAVDEFCLKHNVDIILRGHQINNEMYKNGYRISFDGRLVTLFSAPNYMNYKNNSCIVTISERPVLLSSQTNLVPIRQPQYLSCSTNFFCIASIAT
uniref:Serine/threonine-protein phosphatase n=1 Tax=Angiostrongylus cantonensis TaxID=6313 RepID=A0A0K0D3F5_ANGCA